MKPTDVRRYARLGWPLVAFREKKPVEKDWGNIPALDVAGIESVLADGQNIAVRLGPESGIVDVEADSKAAEANVRKLFGGSPRTPTFRSPRGLHRFFRWDDRLEDSASSVVKIDEIEFRLGSRRKATASLLPPSTTDGYTRRWEPGLAPWEVPPAPLPDAMIDRLRTCRKAAPSSATGKKIAEGKRNETLTRAAGAMRRQGMSVEEMLPSLRAVNNARCAPPLTDSEVRAIARSVGRYAPALTRREEPDQPTERNQQGAGLFAKIEPWPRPVDGKKLLLDLEAYLRQYVVLPDDAGLVIVGWCMAAWSIECWDRFPHLDFASPEKRCGKTRALQALEQICPRPLNTASISPAALYRAVEQHRPTLLIDEAQSLTRRCSESAETLRELLNAGIDKNATVLRIGGPERDTLLRFAVYSPKVLALIGGLDPVLADRCLTIRMERKTDADRVAPWRSRLVQAQARPLAQRLARWTADNAEGLAKVYDAPEPFPLRNDRLAELMLPLQAVVKVADPKKLSGLKRYAARLDDGDVETESPGVQLLAAMRHIFGDKDFLPTAELIVALALRADEPWKRWNRGHSITNEALASLLRHFDIRPAQSRNKKVRGYYRADFETAWSRYLAPPRESRPARPTRPGTGTRKPAKKTATDGRRRGKA